MVQFMCPAHTNPSWTDYRVHHDGKSAGACLKEAQTRHPSADGYRWRIQRRRDDGLPEDWREREQARFDNGTYKPVPWVDADWYQPFAKEHFCHMSMDELGKVAFTENEKKGEADRQTRIGPGRYLTRFFKDVLDASEIERLACEVSILADACGLKITQDADEIEEVYTNGPRSCMSGDADDYSGPCHPARVYGGPDLGVAYTGAKEKASGRCIVWPEKKLYSTIYGDTVRMRRLLKDAGYEECGLDGARIRRITAGYGGTFVLPYIDDCNYVDDDGTYLILGRGSIGCRNTNGLSDDLAVCAHCGERYDSEDEGGYIEERDESWCGSCYDHHTTYDELLEQSRPTDGNVEFIEVHAIAPRWSPSRGGIHVITAGDDNDGLVYIEERDEHWTQEALDLATAIQTLAVAFSGPQLPLQLAA
jgi:hypothetical protein